MLSITALYAGVITLLVTFLSARVVLLRRKHRIGIGHGKNEELALAIRVQANCIEYAPLALLLMALIEANGLANPTVIHIIGSLLLIARLLHAYGLGHSAGTSMGRLIGTALTWSLLLILAGINVGGFFSVF